MANTDRTRLISARRVGLELGIAALCVAALLTWRERAPTLRAALMVMGALLTLTAVIRPALLAPAARQWMRLGAAIGRFTSPILLSVIYYVALTPMGWLRRNIGRSPLHRDRRAATYWVARAPRALDAARESMRRLF